MDEHNRRGDDPRIEQMEQQLAELARRLDEHEDGGKKRSENLGKKLDALDRKIEDMRCDKDKLEQLDVVINGDPKDTKEQGLRFDVALILKTMERAEKILWVLLGTGITYFVISALEHLFPKVP